MNSSMNSAKGESSEFAETLDIIRQSGVFDGTPLEAKKLLAFICHRQVFQPGNSIFRQGEDDGTAYYILSGRTQLILEKDTRHQVIREYGPGKFFGGFCLITPLVKLFSLVALEATTCITIHRKAFAKVGERFPEIALKMISERVSQLVDADKKNIQAYLESQNPKVTESLGLSLI